MSDDDLRKLCYETALMIVGRCVDDDFTTEQKIDDVNRWLKNFAAKVKEEMVLKFP